MAYPLVKVDCVFSCNDIADGRSTLLGRRLALWLGRRLIFNHLSGVCRENWAS